MCVADGWRRRYCSGAQGDGWHMPLLLSACGTMSGMDLGGHMSLNASRSRYSSHNPRSRGSYLMLQHSSVQQQPQQPVHRRGGALSRRSSLVPGCARRRLPGRAAGRQSMAAQPAQTGVALPQRAQHAAPAAQDVILLYVVVLITVLGKTGSGFGPPGGCECWSHSCQAPSWAHAAEAQGSGVASMCQGCRVCGAGCWTLVLL